MQPFNRPAQVAALAEKGDQWTQNWLKRRAKNGAAQFYWPKYPNAKGKTVNKLIAPVLLDKTSGHCAYCDKFPLFPNDETIDHFKPKSVFPELAYNWENLYPACSSCQFVKMEQFHELLIRPDEAGYDFNHYFYIDYTTFEILPSPGAPAEDQERASLTIAILGLKHPAHNKSRHDQYKRFYGEQQPVLEDFAYRYLFL